MRNHSIGMYCDFSGKFEFNETNRAPIDNLVQPSSSIFVSLSHSPAFFFRDTHVCYVPLEMTSPFLHFPFEMRLSLFSSSKRPIKNVLPPRKLLLQSIRYAIILVDYAYFYCLSNFRSWLRIHLVRKNRGRLNHHPSDVMALLSGIKSLGSIFQCVCACFIVHSPSHSPSPFSQAPKSVSRPESFTPYRD